MSVIKKILKKFVVVKKEKILIPYMEGHFLDNRCALITGSSSGIGFSIAKSFLKNGADVIITGRNIDKLERVKAELLAELKCDASRITTERLDITKIDALDDDFNKITQRVSKKIDIFVNNAGVNLGNVFPDTKQEDFDAVINTNLRGSYFFSQIAAKYMVANNIKGNILNVTSSSALRPAISPYIVSKWGERGLTLGLAKKYLSYGIVVNAIAPGSTATNMIKKDNLDDLSCNYTPTGRYMAPEEVANLATILVSDMGKMIIGDTIYATGGAGVVTIDDMRY